MGSPNGVKAKKPKPGTPCRSSSLFTTRLGAVATRVIMPLMSAAKLRGIVGPGLALSRCSARCAPVSSPVNTLVVAPGRYSFGDFVRVGVPFSVVVLVVSVILVPLLLPF